MVGRVLRIEGAAVLVAALAGYAHADGSWVLLLVLFLAPDLAMPGDFAGPRVGSIADDAGHTYALPVPLLAVGVVAGNALLVRLAPIWLASIGMDRTIGYGLTYATGFKDTHPQRV